MRTLVSLLLLLLLPLALLVTADGELVERACTTSAPVWYFPSLSKRCVTVKTDASENETGDNVAVQDTMERRVAQQGIRVVY